MYKSLEYFMEKYPFFLSKKSDSNFTKTKKVFNNRLQDISNNIFITYLASKLEKTVLVWKEQEDEYDYIINFIANVPLLKTVTCYKNDEVIYCESYNYEDNVSTFVYSYEDTSVNVIPDDKFLISVETWEEYTLAKGFPENDTYQDDEYDHDLSLDDFGLLYDMPRKTYTYKNNTNLADTEPPFNNRFTEDDYHYMNRLLFYISHLNDTPLPVLEIWKLFGIPLEEIEFTNREKYLCKMYSQKLHGGDDWEPEPWEHKDSMGCYSSEGLFFFVELDNPTPVVGQMINFTFTFMDMFGEKKTSDYLINVYLDDVLIKSGIDPNNDYTFDTTDVEASTLVFRFEAESESIIETLVSDDFLITLKDCNTADWYVSLEGSDVTGDGSQLNPFKTLPRALSCVEGSRNVIVLCEGEFTINSEQVISTSTSIISCNDAIIRNDTSIDFFRILQGCNLYLKNVALKYRCCTMQDNVGFINKNVTNNPVYIRMNTGLVVDGVNLLCKPKLTFDLDEISDNMYAHSNITVTGTLLTESTPSEPVEDETVHLITGGEVVDTSITDEDGEFELEYLVSTTGEHTFQCSVEESDDYCDGISEDFSVTASAMPTSLSATMDSTLDWGDDLNVVYSLEDYYDNPITVGTIKLKEGNTVVASVTAGETLSYTPDIGSHTFKLVWEAPDNSWIASETGTFNVTVDSDCIGAVVTCQSISLPDLNIVGTGSNLIDWGDGTIESHNNTGVSHTYTDGVTNHTVKFMRATITELGDYSFMDCTCLKSVEIPSGVTTIGLGCFYGCTGLTSITIPSSVTTLKDGCFADCTGLTSVTLSNGVTSIGMSCFGGCTSLTSIIIPSSVTIIKEGGFDRCTSLTSVTLNEGLTTLETAFYNCPITSLTIPSTVTSLGESCFEGCNDLEEIILKWTTSNNIITYDDGYGGWATYLPSSALFYIPDNTRSLYEAKSYPSNLIRSTVGLGITSTKQIIKSGESTTVTAKLGDVDGYGIPDKTLSYQLKHGSTVISSGSDVTDSNGEVDITYTGTAVGQVDVIVSYGMLLQETFVCYDCFRVQTGTINDWYQSNAVLEDNRVKWVYNNSYRYLGLRGSILSDVIGETFTTRLKVDSEKPVTLAVYYNDGSQWLTLDSMVIYDETMKELTVTVPSEAVSVWVRLQSYSSNPLAENDVIYVDEWEMYYD
ncbi:MAG: leucine-rich repeat protein [Methanobrevibacter sp.]|nr:leucine-rich repeat protein [Methanobrevibacter sp.]